jgi:hypothetical protein
MGNDVKVDLAGSVGFDQTLKMTAAVPVTGAMLGNQAALQEIVGGTKIGVPIGGTMMRPAIDGQALRVGLKEQSREIIKRGASRGASQLLDRAIGTRGAAAGAATGGDPAGQLIDRFTGGRGASAGAGTGAEGAPASPIPRDLKGLEQEALRRLIPSRRNPRPR